MKYNWDEAAVRKFLASTKAEAKEASRRGAYIVADKAKRNLEGQAVTGRGLVSKAGLSRRTEGTGQLASEIEVYVKEDGTGYIVEGQPKKVKGRKKSGPERYYAAYLELGHLAKKKDGSFVHIAPRPYLRPAIRASKKEIRDIFKGLVGDRMP
jgi:hypothetical protein